MRNRENVERGGWRGGRAVAHVLARLAQRASPPPPTFSYLARPCDTKAPPQQNSSFLPPRPAPPSETPCHGRRLAPAQCHRRKHGYFRSLAAGSPGRGPATPTSRGVTSRGPGRPTRAGRFCSRPRRTALISDLGEAGEEGTGAHVARGPWQERAPWWPRERGFYSKHRWALLLLHHGVSLAPQRPPCHPEPGLPLPGRRGRGQVLPVGLWVRGDVSCQPCPSPGCTSLRSGVC